jgi:hypothetical protein
MGGMSNAGFPSGRRDALIRGGASLLGILASTARATAGDAVAKGDSQVFDPNRVTYRRIITANDEQGRSYLWKDETLKRGDPAFVELWWTSPQDPLGINVAAPGEPKSAAPSNGGSGKMRMVYYTCMPTPKRSAEQERSEFAGAPPQSEFDTGILLNGELVLFLEKDQVIVHPGDVLVIRSARHFWRNYTQTPGVLFGTNTMI